MQRKNYCLLFLILFLCALTASQFAFAQSTAARSAAVERVRHLYYNQDGWLATAEANRLFAKNPDDIELAGWHVMLGQNDSKAADYVAAMKKKAPDSPWTLLAESQTTSGPQVEKLCNEAIAKSNGDPDILYLATQRMSFAAYLSHDEAKYKAFVESHKNDYAKSSEGLYILASAEQSFARGASSKGDSIIAIYDKALQLDPKNVGAAIGKANVLKFAGKFEKSRELLKATVQAVPDSYSLHAAYWNAIVADIAIKPEEQQKQIVADALQFFSQYEPSAQTVNIAFNTLEGVAPKSTKEVADLILKKYPDSPASDAVSLTLAMKDLPMAAPEQNVTAKIIALEKFLDRPKHYDDEVVKQANRNLIGLLASEDNPDLDRLYKATVAVGGDPRGITVLATHKVHLPEIEFMAMKQADAQWAEMRTAVATQEDKTGFLDFWMDSFVEPWQDALGWVYFNEGKLDEAQAKLEFASKLSPDNVTAAIHLGRVYEAQGQLDKAETTFKEALVKPYYGEGDHPAVKALRDLYIHRHGNADGVDAYMKPILEQDLQRRKRAVLSARIRSPKEIANFSLKTLDGKTVTSSDLKGKITVINFWATWCGPCRKELPDLNKFYEKYKNDPNIVILTMATDEESTPTAVIENFISKNKYSFPVLRAPEYATRNGINTIPLTWFVDPTGHIVFSKLGYSKELMQEYAWRVNALLKSETNVATSKSN